VSAASGSLHTVRSRRRAARAGVFLLALIYVGILLLAPLSGIVWQALNDGWQAVLDTFALADVRHAFWLTFIITAVTVSVTSILGVVAGYVLGRHRFRGRSVLNALVDLPMAVSPVTVGLMVVLLFGRGGWFEPFFSARGIQVIFALPSMVLVTTFICIPFVIREVQPLLEELGTNEEEAAHTLGASSIQAFFKVTLPNIKWAVLYGTALATARALGEIGAVLIVSGSLQGQTETATLYIFRALEERQGASANAVALTLAGVSILLLVAIEFFKKRKVKESEV
jgi:sulfate/thiosulfate transport system permease protein